MTYTRQISDIFRDCRTFLEFFFQNIDGEEVKVASYDNKGSFGELALMYNAPRAATVTSVDGGTLWALDRQVKRYMTYNMTLKWFYIELFQTYIRIIVRANAKKRRTYEQFIETVHLLKVGWYGTDCTFEIYYIIYNLYNTQNEFRHCKNSKGKKLQMLWNPKNSKMGI